MAAKSKPPRPQKPVAALVTTAKREGHADNYTGKREHTRYTTGMRLEITLDPANAGEGAPVVMHNVSDGGFAFWFRGDLAPRTPVYLRSCDGPEFGEWSLATVRHCTRGLLGYLVGAEFEPADGDAESSIIDESGCPADKTVDTKAEHLRRLVRRQLAAKHR